MYVPLRKAVELTGLHPNTLRKYADDGKIDYYKNQAGQRLFKVDSLPGQKQHQEKVICYCRVSSANQKDDLTRQVAYMRGNFPRAQIIQDIGSGLNFKRKGLRSLLDRILEGDSLTIIVAHRDRLCRFGFELFEYLVKQNGGEIMVFEQLNSSPESELVQDILAILHVFSCRINGLRRYHNIIKEDKNIPKPTAEENL